MSEEEGPDDLKDGQSRPQTEHRRQSTRKERASDFFASVRQLSHPQDELVEDTLLEDTDFFAQVREMIATEDDDAETASRRVSDFFAQIREMSQDEEMQTSTPAATHGHKGGSIPEPCESDVLGSAPVHGRSTGASAAISGSSRALNEMSKGDNSDGDVQSVFSGFSGMLTRGRTSLATTVTAISEKSAQIVMMSGQGRDPASKKVTGRVGGLLQKIQGTKDSADSTEEVMAVGQSAESAETKMAKSKIPDARHSPESKDHHLYVYDGLNDIEAMAAYRKSQEYKRRLSSTNDDASSQSSFHTLPTGILEVVKSRGSTPAKSARHVSTSPRDADEVAQTSAIGQTSMATGSVDSDSKPSTLSRPSTATLSHASDSNSAIDGLHHPEYRRAHEQAIRNSPLLGTFDQDIIDTDGTTSDASYSGIDPSILASLMLSPDLLQKRLRQAVRAVEDRRWEQVRYLLNANPWLAEMCEITTNQYLVHKIAFFGRTAPVALCEHLIEMFPSAIFKFDLDGNVPLHLAAAAGNFNMIRMLGARFASGASIRNEDGMLPLHFAIASYGNYVENDADQGEDETNPSPLTVIKAVHNLFPKAVAIVDNDGNLPIHVAAECLVGNFGVEVVYMLLDEADRQLQDPEGARFYNKVKLDDVMNEDMSAQTENNFSETGSALDGDIHCSMVRNDFGETPLLAAIRCRRGWDMIEALVSGPGGSVAAMFEDTDKSNALHLLVGEHQDPAAAVSILKIAPNTAKMRNSEGMLPIEVSIQKRLNSSIFFVLHQTQLFLS